ncbi:hypothetical protein H4R34_003077, partial [Dimargaris verticillata]
MARPWQRLVLVAVVVLLGSALATTAAEWLPRSPWHALLTDPTLSASPAPYPNTATAVKPSESQSNDDDDEDGSPKLKLDPLYWTNVAVASGLILVD